jgi:acyl-CoA synthetase (AMP-forming)/AMP-acid ligase II
MGVKRGDRVGMWLNNSVELVVGIFGILKADAVFVSLSRLMKPEKAASLLNDCQAVTLITDARAIGQGVGERVKEGAASVRNLVVVGGRARNLVNGCGAVLDFEEIVALGEEEIRNSKSETRNKFEIPSSNPDVSSSNQHSKNIDLDLACLIYTSGTTGESKGVMCDHSNVVFVTQSIVEYLRNSERDTTMCVLPLSFSYGLYQLTAMFAVGGTLVLEQSFAFPDMVLEQMAKERVTGFAGVPTIYSMILSMDLSKYDLGSLRYLTNAAAGLPIEHVKRLRQIFPKVDLYLMHGLTEVARTMYLPPSQTDARPASSGIPIPGTELWIEDDDGNRLPPGQVGELVVRGRNVMRGYWNAQEMTAKKFRPGPMQGERVCYSGDLFRMDEEGYFYFVSRKDDLIKCRGEKVAPREVENVLYRISGVLEAAVIGVPDPIMGQVVKAFIVAPGMAMSEVDVISHCKANLEEFMVPRLVEFRNDLPKTSSGKIRKVELT